MTTHPYVSEWRESHLTEWRDTDMAERITLEAPELRHVDDPAITRCAITANGTAIGRSYSRVSRDSGSVTGPYRTAPSLSARVLGWLGSMKALFIGIAIGAALVLLSGCSGPSDVDAAIDTAAALQDAIAQAQRERPDLWTPETIERAKTAALIAAASRK